MDTKEHDARIEIVRKASRRGELTPVTDGAFSGSEDEFAAWKAGVDADDLCHISESGRLYLFSILHMTRRYAEAAALGASGDPTRMIAATVRSESATYPRPTPVETFFGPPYDLTPDALKEAVAQVRSDPGYSDIEVARASNGAEFLFSSTHLNRDQAAAIAERLAVGKYENP